MPKGTFPNASFGAYGHYKYDAEIVGGAGTTSYTDAVFNTSGGHVNLVDPLQTGNTGFSKMIAGYTFDPDSLINYRAYLVSPDTDSYLRYTTGEFLATFPDTTLEPIGFAWMPIGKTFSAKADIESVLQTDTFLIMNGSAISFVHNLTPSDTFIPFLELGAGNSVTYKTQLIAGSRVITLDSITLNGAADSADVTIPYCAETYDTVAIGGFGAGDTVQAFIQISAAISDGNPSAYINNDTAAYLMYNIFADNPANGDTTDGLQKRPLISASPVPFNFSVYPNPAHSQIQYAYALAQTGNVDVGIYDVYGRQVYLTANGMQTTGAHNFGYDVAGLPSGCYFVAVYVDGAVKSRGNFIVIR
jgi:hypothetical protein